MSDGPDTYRDALAAAHARIRELEHELALRDAEDAASPLFAKLRAQRERILAQGRRFWGLGPDGIGALVVLTLVLGTAGALFAILLGGLAPIVLAFVVTALFVGMMVLTLRSDKRKKTRHALVRVDASIEEATRRVAAVRAEEARVRVAEPPEAEEAEEEQARRSTLM
jgi:hypothetical protein